MRAFKIILSSIVLSLVISCAIMYVQIRIIKKNTAEYYRDSHDNISVSIFKSGNDIYVSERDDIKESMLNKRKGALEYSGGSFIDSDKQMRSYCSKFLNGINSTNIYSLGNEPVMTDARLYFDENGHSIMMDDTLFFVRRNNDNKGGELFYTFYDEKVAENIHKLCDAQGNDSMDLYFYVDGVYAKDDEFIPGSLDVRKIENGRKGKPTNLYTLDKSKEEMEAEGYKYYEITDAFSIGETITNDRYCTYYCAVSDDIESRVEELLKPYIDQNMQDGEGDSIVNNLSLLKQEMFYVSKYVSPDSGKNYYIVSYENMNILYENSVSGGIDFFMMPYFVLFIAETLGLLIVGVFAGIIISIIKSKN